MQLVRREEGCFARRRRDAEKKRRMNGPYAWPVPDIAPKALPQRDGSTDSEDICPKPRSQPNLLLRVSAPPREPAFLLRG